MKQYAARVIFLCCILCLASRPGLAGDASAETVEITVLATGDFHGALEPRHAKVVGGREVGGIGMIAAYFDAVRAANPGGVVLLDAGDCYQGTLLSAASEGKAVIEVYNQLGYDAGAIGNHDFDFGPLGYHSVPDSPDDDPVGVLKSRLDQARFPFLAANILERQAGKPPGWQNLAPYTILERKGIKIGVVGLSSVDTPLVTHPANVRTLEFRPLLSSLRRTLPELRSKGAQVVIVLAHAGVELDEQSGEISGPLARLARSLEPGEIDLIIGGHTHQPFSKRINGIPVVLSWPNGIAFNRVDLTIDRASGKVLADKTVLRDNTFYFHREKDGTPIVYEGRELKPRARFVRNLKIYRRSIAHLQRIRLGRALRNLANKTELDSPVGNLVTDAMRAADPQIEIAMYNSGGLRTSIPKGTVTFGRIYEVVPFDNFLVKVTLSGAQIREILEHGLSAPYGVMEISGLQVRIDRDAPAGKRCLTIETEDGQALIDERLYVVGTNEFVLNGGDGYFTFSRGRDVHNTHTLIRELVARYIKSRGTVSPDMGGRYRSAEKSGDKKNL